MSRFDCFPCTPIFNTSITDPPTSHCSNDRSPNRSIDFERSSVNFKGFHLRTGSLSLSLPLKKFDRDILIACAKNTKGEVSRRKQLEAIWSPESGAHQRKPNFLPSFIDANILFDSDLLETRHVRAVETTFGRGSASGLSRETLPPPMDNRISNSRRQISWISSTFSLKRHRDFRSCIRWIESGILFLSVICRIYCSIVCFRRPFFILSLLRGLPYRRIRIIFEILIHTVAQILRALWLFSYDSLERSKKKVFFCKGKWNLENFDWN